MNENLDVTLGCAKIIGSRRGPPSSLTGKIFLVQLPKLADLTTHQRFEDVLVISCLLHQLIHIWHRALAMPFGQPLYKVSVL